MSRSGSPKFTLGELLSTLKKDELVGYAHTVGVEKASKMKKAELAERLEAEVIQVIGGVIVLYREADEERIAEKKKKRGSGTAKATAKKKVKIKGKRQRQKEKQAKNPYAKYDRPKYHGR